MIIVNSQKNLTLEIVENVQLKIMDALVSINIYIIDLLRKNFLLDQISLQSIKLT